MEFYSKYNHDNVDCFWLMYPACSMRAKRRVYSASRVRCTQTRHHRANHLRALKDYLRVEKDYLRLGKTIYRLKKTIYGFDLVSSE